jgi:predicted transglutaminase-like cysteine proteinase
MRFDTLLSPLALLLVIACPTLSSAGTDRPLPKATSATATTEVTAPRGWQDFCRRYEEECRPQHTPAAKIPLNSETWQIISDINTWVNHEITPMTDLAHWGVVDQWDIPNDKKGDCEDFALLKRKTLMSFGLPQSALLMTVVINQRDEGHAVLTAATDRGDLILDNVTDQIISWDRTSYYFVERQSMRDPNIWQRLANPDGSVLVASQREILQHLSGASAITER